MRSQFKAIDELVGLDEDKSLARVRCAQVFKALDAEGCFPFSVSESLDAGDVHLNFDRYGVPTDCSLLKEMEEGIDPREKRAAWPFLGQSGVTQPLFIPVNKTTEVKVCTADVIHS